MLLFTSKTRRLIDSAVQRLPDETRRQLWQTWVKENPQLRRPDGITDDGGPPPPSDVVLVMQSALVDLEAAKRREMNAPDLSEDEVSDLESDLTYIIAVSRLLQQIPTR
jgi:hypothetical protein